METNRLDIVPGKIAPVIHTSQYDVGRVFRFYLYDGTSPFTLNGSETVTCSIRKTDGNIVILSVENTADNYVDVVTTEQSTACAGQNICELRIEDGDTNIGTMDFILQVESDPTEGGIESETEINNLRTQVADMVAEEVATQYESDSVIFDTEPTEGHGIGFAVTSEGVKSAIKEATTPTGTVSGDVVTFDDALNGVPFIEVEAQIEATQSGSGTPSPDNNRPINGFSEVKIDAHGKNLLPYPYKNADGTYGGVTVSTDANGKIHLQGQSGGSTALFRLFGDAATPVPPWIKGGKTYSLYPLGVSSKYSVQMILYGSPAITVYGGHDVTLPNDLSSYTGFAVIVQLLTNTTYDDYIEPMIAQKAYNASEPFAPFKGSTHTVDLGQTVGKGVLNVTTGELTITHKVVDLGSFNWVKSGDRMSTEETDAKMTASGSSYPDMICEIYPIGTPNSTYTHVMGITVNNSNQRIFVYDGDYSDADAFKTAVTGHKVLYELATPVTVQLTPEEIRAISGLNTVSANSGEIEVVYRKDFGIFADAIPYDNTVSGLTADNVQEAIDEVADNTYTKTEADALLADKADTADLATVATSGAYNDLTGKPTIPSIDSVTPPNQMTVGSTYQLPASVFAHGLIVLTARRYGYIGEATITRASIIGGTATQGIYCPYSATTGWLFTIDASGLLTYKQAVGSSPDPTVEIVGIF